MKNNLEENKNKLTHLITSSNKNTNIHNVVKPARKTRRTCDQQHDGDDRHTRADARKEENEEDDELVFIPRTKRGPRVEDGEGHHATPSTTTLEAMRSSIINAALHQQRSALLASRGFSEEVIGKVLRDPTKELEEVNNTSEAEGKEKEKGLLKKAATLQGFGSNALLAAAPVVDESLIAVSSLGAVDGAQSRILSARHNPRKPWEVMRFNRNIQRHAIKEIHPRTRQELRPRH